MHKIIYSGTDLFTQTGDAKIVDITPKISSQHRIYASDEVE